MRAVVIYESMYGNTHAVAEHIARGLRTGGDADVVAVRDLTTEALDGVDLVVCGGPTHVHTLSSARSRQAAATVAEKDESLTLEPGAAGTGLRDWFRRAAAMLPTGASIVAAAFDTRAVGPGFVTGRASRSIARHLRHLGFELLAPPESFLVDRQTRLLAGEAERAEAWGEALARADARRPVAG